MYFLLMAEPVTSI